MCNDLFLASLPVDRGMGEHITSMHVPRRDTLVTVKACVM